jgi:tRNA dimethylallyltransferase
MHRPILIAGPTASGKSAAAIVLAERLGGTIVNADSMQVYRDLSILTARPPAEDEARVPHRLYGHVAAAVPYSVGLWLADVARAIATLRADGRVPIIVGGTGLYFEALLNGLSPVPDIPLDLRTFWRAEAERIGPVRLHAELAARDPAMAARLYPTDPQRVTRAIEVIEATGRSLAEWQRETSVPLLAAQDVTRIVILPEREHVFAACDSRFDSMLRAGALAEVAALQAQNLPTERPAMRATGVRALIAHLKGELSLAEATERGKIETRQYAKRQMTWLRGRMGGWDVVPGGAQAVDLVKA